MTKIYRTACLVLLFSAAFALPAQQTRQTVTNPSTDPKDDSKPNSPSVPGAYSLTGRFDRVVIIRVKPGEDLLAGITKEVKEQKIQNGVILSAIGSMRGYAVHQVTNRTLPTQNTIEKNPTQPVDLVSMNGYIVNGRVHAHMTVATPDRVIGGHLERGTEVYTYGIVTIGVMNNTNLEKIDDKGYR